MYSAPRYESLSTSSRNRHLTGLTWKETAAKTTDGSLFLPTKARVNRLVSCIIMIVVLVLLILPVYALYHVSSSFSKQNANTSNAICMGILLVATLLFSATLALFTKAKRHELLGAAAAWVGACQLIYFYLILHYWQIIATVPFL